MQTESVSRIFLDLKSSKAATWSRRLMVPRYRRLREIHRPVMPAGTVPHPGGLRFFRIGDKQSR